MKEFPSSSVVDKVFSESKFFKKLALSKRTLPFGTIEKIVWRNKISATTVNVKEGESVKEIQVFEVILKRDAISEAILKTIDNNIPYHILYLIRFEDKYQAWLGYKEVNSVGVSLTIKNYNKTSWLNFDELPLEINGLTLDDVYDNFLSQINSNIEQVQESPTDLRLRVNNAEVIRKLEAEIEKLTAKLFKEKQFNKQVKLNEKLKILKTNLETIKNG